PHGAADVAGWHPGQLLRPLRGILGSQLLEQLKGRPTCHRVPISQGERVGAGERGYYTVLPVPAVGMIVYGAAAPFIPDNAGVRLPCRREVVRGEELVRVRPHQEGAVRPLAGEGRIVELLLQEDVEHAQ